MPFAFPLASQLGSCAPSKPLTPTPPHSGPFCRLPPAPRLPHTLQRPRQLLACLLLFLALCSSLDPAPPPCVRLRGASPGTVTETPTWHSPERLAAGRGVAGTWEGAGSGGGVPTRPGLPLTRGRAQKARQMGARPPLPFPPLSCSVRLSIPESPLPLSLPCHFLVTSRAPDVLTVHPGPPSLLPGQRPAWAVWRALGIGWPSLEPHGLPEDLEPPKPYTVKLFGAPSNGAAAFILGFSRNILWFQPQVALGPDQLGLGSQSPSFYTRDHSAPLFPPLQTVDHGSTSVFLLTRVRLSGPLTPAWRPPPSRHPSDSGK